MERSWITDVTPPSNFDDNLSASAIKVIEFLKENSGLNNFSSSQLNSTVPSFNSGYRGHNSMQNHVFFFGNNCPSEYHVVGKHKLDIYDQHQHFDGNIKRNKFVNTVNETQAPRISPDYVNVDELFLEPTSRNDVVSLDNFSRNSSSSIKNTQIGKSRSDFKYHLNENNSELITESNNLNYSIDMFSQSDLSVALRKPTFKRLLNYLPSKKTKAKPCQSLYKNNKIKLKCNPENKITNYFQELKNEKLLEKKVWKSSENQQRDLINNYSVFKNFDEHKEKIKNNNSQGTVTHSEELTKLNEISLENLNSPFVKLNHCPPPQPKMKRKLNTKNPNKTSPERHSTSSINRKRSNFNIYMQEKPSCLHEPQKNEDIFELKIVKYNEDMTNEFHNELITEIGFTICYKHGFCTLNKPLQDSKKIYPPNGIMAKFEFENKTIKYLFIGIESLKSKNCREFVNFLLNHKCRKVCFEAQSFILLMLDCLELVDKRECYDWCIMDPLLGIWLLDPDKRHASFDAIKKTLTMAKEVHHEEWMINACQYLKEQSHSMELINSQLVSKSLWKLFIDLETKVIPIIAVMETQTIKIDKEKMIKIGGILTKKLTLLENQGMNLAGKQFQIRSSLQLRKIFYEDLKLDQMLDIPIKGTASTGDKSTAEPILKRLAKIHPLPQIVLEYRHLQKWKSTYIDGILNHILNKTFISTSWEHFSAVTGRITSNSPNLQAIPKQTLEINGDGGLNIRSTFISREDHTFVSVDFQQIELRIFAHLSKDKKLIRAFHEENDIFTAITNLRFGTKTSDPEERTRTKTLVYAHLYGAGINKIAEILSLDESTAADLTNRFHNLFPGLRNFRYQIIEKCKKQQYLVTIGGRQRHFPNINSLNPQVRTYSERQAVNFVIQGSAADICKVAMLNTERKLRNEQKQCKLLLQIHDEFVWEVADNHVKEVVDLVKDLLESETSWPENIKLIVPLKVKVTQGKNWGEMT
ncbi:DNA polymerase nu-like isoform X2 [Rhodnius prolixus]